MIRAGRNIITHDILAHLDHARTQPPPAQISHPIAARVSAVSAALRVSWCNDAKALLRFGFDQPAAGLCHIACARLAGPDAAESWLIDDPIIATQTDTLQRRSEEHTSELQSLMRISYAVFCLKKKTTTPTKEHQPQIYGTN